MAEENASLVAGCKSCSRMQSLELVQLTMGTYIHVTQGGLWDALGLSAQLVKPGRCKSTTVVNTH
jgi:hypothetical protein